MSHIMRRAIFRTSNTSLARQLLANRRCYADEATSGSGGLNLTFGTPHMNFYDKVGVSQVDVPSMSGAFGILPNHVPVIATLKPGVVTVMADGESSKFFVSSGTVTVNVDSSAQILAEEAAPLENLDIGSAQQGLEQAQSQLSSAADEEGRARATISVEFHEALVKALQ